MISFRNRKLATWATLILGGLGLLSVVAPWLPVPAPEITQLNNRLAPPGHWPHILGTDLLGRDILSRLLHGTRLSLSVALLAALGSGLIGGSLGILAGYFRKWFDSLCMRSIDLLMAFPYMILALAIVAILGPGLINALIAIAIVNIPFFARTARGLTLGLNQQNFILAARLSGKSHLSILIGEVFPNVFPVLMITMTTTLGWMLLETAGLSFLGLGAQPPVADLGSMLAEGRKLMLINPHVALAPGLVILVLAICINVLGDSLRDELDPRLKARQLKNPSATTQVSPFTEENSPPQTSTSRAHLPLISVSNLVVEMISPGGSAQKVVNNVNFTLCRGKTLGIVGESGSGKSVTALSITRLLPSPPAKIVQGNIYFENQDLLHVSSEKLRRVRGSGIAYIFQDPLGSLNPLMKVGDQIRESIQHHQNVGSAQAIRQALQWMETVEIPDPAARYTAWPHELSGGQRQRIAIAMALANYPKLLIADEPTTALDVTVQRNIIELLKRLQREHDIGMIFISHDLGVIRAVCDDVIVMFEGNVVETGPGNEILDNPRHSYTRHLLNAVPEPGNPGKILPAEPFKSNFSK